MNSKLNASMAIYLKKGLLSDIKQLETHNGGYDKRSFHSSFLILSLYIVMSFETFCSLLISAMILDSKDLIGSSEYKLSRHFVLFYYLLKFKYK